MNPFCDFCQALLLFTDDMAIRLSSGKLICNDCIRRMSNMWESGKLRRTKENAQMMYDIQSDIQHKKATLLLKTHKVICKKCNKEMIVTNGGWFRCLNSCTKLIDSDSIVRNEVSDVLLEERNG